ncbi:MULTISPECIES: hypothetical protein [Bacteroides]|uniref:Six-hairpin glycosidase-like protein n=4 Tax=Bacteroides TaxID=816 RepID=A0A1C7H8G3_9BACE|nr:MULTISPECIES: hypothetical protein [Bacteroides]ANU59867.1 hypothetical protein A4V03_14785 [Bacteroides caecimuris]OXE62759.1 hypothetical protein ADH74_14345 [Bacteroides caecimuris]QQR19301.1 hypothetical protein I5Q79_14410 [Bacteroides caecimuris]UQA32286.1 hypothetical protein M2854_14530 [Bacteroides caecimuris]
MQKKTWIAVLATLFGMNFLNAGETGRWTIVSPDSICWKVNGAHHDHIEMSGLKVSTVLRYGVNETGEWVIDRNIVLPTFRTIPNDTHASLQHRFNGDWAYLCLVNGQPLLGEKVETVSLSGVMTVKSIYSDKGIALTRTLFPSTSYPVFCEKYELENVTDRSLTVEFPSNSLSYRTDEARGVEGSYTLTATLSSPAKEGVCQLKAGERACFQVLYAGYKKNDWELALDVEKELMARREFLRQVQSNLVLETPSDVINTMFSFAKIRGSESIFDTKGGYMQSPGGEAYYAGIWANDQAEYINPFFPYLGYPAGNRSAMNSFSLFMRYMNDEYKPLPSSIIAEGIDCFGVAGDRGDVAMVGYGAARYALASGNRHEAEKLWPLIEWCLEYCNRKLNAEGVVESDSDELENRFPSGKANLCTSSLYYDALISATYLGKALKKDREQIKSYRDKATELYKNMDAYFAWNVEGYETYRYYDGNDVLRSWICIPLTMGIYDRAEGTVSALFSDKLWMENGLLTQSGTSTYWDRSTLYAFRGAYACGAREIATEYLEKYSATRLLGDHVPYAVEAWPEGNQRHLSTESALYCRIMTEGLFGIRPIALNAFKLTPQLPEGWNTMSLKRICAFGATFDIEVKRNKGNALQVLIKKDNNIIEKYKVENGKSIEVRIK